jgi:hypothetical protein
MDKLVRYGLARAVGFLELEEASGEAGGAVEEGDSGFEDSILKTYKAT